MHAHINSQSHRRIPTDAVILRIWIILTEVTISWTRRLSIVCLRCDLYNSLWRLTVLCCAYVSPFRRDMSLLYLKYVISFQFFQLCHTPMPNWDTGMFINTYRTTLTHSGICTYILLRVVPSLSKNNTPI